MFTIISSHRSDNYLLTFTFCHIWMYVQSIGAAAARKYIFHIFCCCCCLSEMYILCSCTAQSTTKNFVMKLDERDCLVHRSSQTRTLYKFSSTLNSLRLNRPHAEKREIVRKKLIVSRRTEKKKIERENWKRKK